MPTTYMLEGHGVRRVCERDEECLTGWIHAHPPDGESEPEGHCSPTCAHHVPVRLLVVPRTLPGTLARIAEEGDVVARPACRRAKRAAPAEGAER